jgi:hypothetical protein
VIVKFYTHFDRRLSKVNQKSSFKLNPGRKLTANLEIQIGIEERLTFGGQPLLI